MRDIKFHAWDKASGKMCGVAKLYLCGNGKQAIIYDLDSGLNHRTVELSSIILLQYIGKQDNNGKEIYEGHIMYCENDECIGYIANSDEEAGYFFLVQNENGEFEQRDIYDYIGSIEIIGDVYNNPEMVEGAK